jgi:predicted metal-dependent peptidase
MTATNLVALDRVMKARSELILARRFYGVLVSNVEPVETTAVETMATNSRQHFYNPDFVATLTQTQLLAVQAHETEHDARHHCTRRNGRDPKRWNEACDYAINPDLKAEGFDLPPWVLLDERFRGMSAEDIYRIRELEQEQQEQNQPQPQDGDAGDDNEAGADGDEQSDSDDNEAGNEAGDNEADDTSDDEGDGNAPGADTDGDDEGDGDEGQSEGDGDAGDEGAANGTGTGDDAGREGQAGDGNGEASDDTSDGDEAGEQPGQGGQQSHGDPGRCGEVLDAPGDADETDMHWERNVRQAVSMAKKAGQLPGHITREIERANEVTQDWREVLREWIDAGSRRIETWNRPNRRFAGRGLILPGSQRDGLNHVALIVDTSGSMDDVALKCVATEMQGALDSGAIDKVTVIYGDTRVTRVDEYSEGDQMVFDPRGGGGTQLEPLFDYAAQHLSDVSLVLCFTDGFFGDLGRHEAPESPVLFCFTGYPQHVREHIANAPWDAAGIDVGAH